MGNSEHTSFPVCAGTYVQHIPRTEVSRADNKRNYALSGSQNYYIALPTARYEKPIFSGLSMLHVAKVICFC